MKKAKWFTAVLPLAMAVSSIASADDTLSAKVAGEMLGQASISRRLQPEYQRILQKILLGQDYEYRASVIDTQCINTRVSRTCEFTIGTDDLNDDDRGWGATYKLFIETKLESSHILAVEMRLVAG